MNGWHAGHRPGIICQVCRGMRNLVRLFAYLCHPVLHNNQKIVSNFLKDKTLLSNCGCLSLGCSLCPWKLHRVTLCLSRNCYFSFVWCYPFYKSNIQTEVPLQEFHVCHTHYVISGGNRKGNTLQNCCRKQFLFLAYCFISSTSLWQ